MSWLDDLGYRLRVLRQRRRHELELDDELRFHLEMEVERRMAQGQGREAAERAAQLELGAEQSIKEECREAWGTWLVDEVWRDLRGAVRHLARERRFTLVAVGSLAIGIGAAAIIFSVVDAVLLRPLPYGEPARIVAFQETTPDGDPFSTSDANLIDFAERSRTLDAIAALSFPTPRPALGRDSERVRLAGMAVTPSFFRVLGVPAALGRTFGPEEDVPGTEPRVVVLSHQAWRQHFGADRELIGENVDLDGELFTVIGVLPEGFRFGRGRTDVFLPHVPDPEFPRGDHRLDGLARLAPGATLEQAQSEVRAIAAQLSDEYPDSNDGWGAQLEPIDEFLLGESARRTNLVLLGAVGLLLLLACVNVSNLLLARGADRAAEIRLRLALGASRARVVWQLLTESALVGLLGAASGLLLAYWLVPIVRGLEVALPRMDEMAVDARVVLFVLLAAAISGATFGIVPALRITKTPAAESLRTRLQGSDRQGSRLRAGLVATEVALATVLTVAAGLLVRSFDELRTVDSGFESAGVLLAQVDLPPERYPESSDASTTFYDELIESLEALPGALSAGATMVSPFRGPSPTNQVGTEDEQERDAFVQVQWRSVMPDTFRALGIPMLEGQGFGDERRLETVISAQLAERLWPGQDALGMRMRWIQPEGPLFEVVGVVGEVQDLHLGGDPPPTVYLPQRVVGWPTMTVTVRVEGSPERLAGPVRHAVRELDPLLAAPAISTLEQHRRVALARPLLSLRLMVAFAAIALLLAAVGVYGIVAYSVSRRRGELGLRVALGARPSQLAALVVRGSAWMVGAGLGAGLLGSLALVNGLRALLYQTSPFDPRVLGGVAVLLMAVGLLASWTPALRAARLDPVGSLREE